MPSKNLCCSWQLILVAAVVLRTDYIIADLEAQQMAFKQQQPIGKVMNINKQQHQQSTVDSSINSNTIENGAINVIRLQPPPLTRTFLMPTPIMGTITKTAATTETATKFNTIKPIALDSATANPTKSNTLLKTIAKTTTAETATTSTTLLSALKVGMENAEITATRTSSSSPSSPLLLHSPQSKPAAVGIKTNHADGKVDDDFLNNAGVVAVVTGIVTTRATEASEARNSETFYDIEDSSERAAAAGAALTTQISNDAATLLHPPSSDSLTKGFTIPTFLPPVREFAVADLPSYLTTTTTTAATTMSDELLQQHDQLYQATYNGHPSAAARKNSTLQSTNVSVQLGNHAYMPCNIRRLQSKPVSWVRVRDGHILAVDQTTFIADQRFQSIFNEENEHTWSLQIKYVQKSDEGWYECQVATEPKMSSKMYLEVVVPTTELIGDQSRFVKAGSKVALHCIVRGTIVPPTYIIWFREKIQIIDDNNMGWFTQIDRNIFGNTSENHNTVNEMIGSLIIPSVRKKDSGNYTCQPSNSEAVSVDLHVLSGEYSASAIMSAAGTYDLNFFYFLIIFLVVALRKT